MYELIRYTIQILMSFFSNYIYGFNLSHNGIEAYRVYRKNIENSKFFSNFYYYGAYGGSPSLYVKLISFEDEI